MKPRMIIIAGPPGSGKSSLYPVSSFGVAYFNADDRAAEVNGGSYAGISNQIRQQVNREFETFVWSQIERRESFAFETTLRSTVTFEQAQTARSRGFTTEMRYLALQSFGLHLERVKARSDAGGHSASDRLYGEYMNPACGTWDELSAKWTSFGCTTTRGLMLNTRWFWRLGKDGSYMRPPLLQAGFVPHWAMLFELFRQST